MFNVSEIMIFFFDSGHVVATSVPSWSFSKESGSDFENLPMQSMNDMSEAVSQVESHFSSESSSGSREERFGRASERFVKYSFTLF